MSRIALTAVATFVALLVVVLSTAAAQTRGVDWTLKGASTWTPVASFEVHTFAAQGSIEGVGTYSGTLTAGDYFTTNTCGPECAPITGTLTFVTKHGSFTGTVDDGGLVSVVVIGSGTYYSFTLSLTVTDGTKSYGRASGQLSLQYSSELRNDGYFPCDPPPCTVQDAGTLTGSLAKGAAA